MPDPDETDGKARIQVEVEYELETDGNKVESITIISVTDMTGTQYIVPEYVEQQLIEDLWEKVNQERICDKPNFHG
jgi:hypothetical protein